LKIKDRIRGFCRLAPERILPNPRNWRTHPDNQRAALQGVLADVGIADAVLVVPCSPGGLASLLAAGADGFGPWLMGYRGEFMLVDGHLRAETITGQPVPALVLDLDEREQAEVLATFDPVGDLAGMDRERFIALAGEFNSTNAAVQGLVADLAAMEERMRGAADAMPDLDAKEQDIEDAFGKLPEGDRDPFQQMTFTLHDSQVEIVKAALDRAKDGGAFDGSPNENSNGNALARICEAYADA
jgi:hypothetical protein